MTLNPKPVISILLPVYNAAATLPACLHSIQRQLEARWECILVDDGSHDETLACARSFAARDDRFRIISRPHCGLVSALNTGLSCCHAPFIARMDGDDLMHRQRLARQLDLLQNDSTLAAVGCHVRIFPRSSLQEGRRNYECWLNSIDSTQNVQREAFVECPVAHPTLLIRRDVLTSYRYRDMGWAEDYDLILRLLTTGQSIGIVPHRLLGWRNSPSRLSITDPIYAINRFTDCKAAFLAAQYLAAADCYILMGFGQTGKALYRALKKYDKRPSYIIELHPGRLGKIIHGAPVVPPSDLPHLPRWPIIASVAGEKSRSQIRMDLREMGFLELEDFVCAA